MLKNFRDKIALSGITVLTVGVILLIFTFLSAYGFLTQSLSIVASEDLVQTFGEALAPLIVTCIHIMYLGVMGWVGSLITIRGVTLIANAPKPELAQPAPTVTAIPQKPAIVAPQPKPAPQKSKTEPQKEPKPPETKPPETKPPEAKQPEPEIIVIPPEEVAPTQPQPQPQQPPNGDSKSQSSNS